MRDPAEMTRAELLAEITRLSNELDKAMRVYEFSIIERQNKDVEIARLKRVEEEWITTCANLTSELGKAKRENEELRKAQSAEPVAWRVKSEEFEDVITDEGDVDFYIQNAYKLTPLYTHPPKQESANPVAWIEPEGKLTFCQNMFVTERTPLFRTPPTATALVEQLAEAKKDAERWNFFIEVLRKDMGESIAKFLPEEPMENFTKEMIDAAIDQAMREGE